MRISDWSSDVCSSDFADGTAPAYDPISIADPQGVYTGPVNLIASSIQAGSLTNKEGYAFHTVKFGEQFELNGVIPYQINKSCFRPTIPTTSATHFGAIAETLFPNPPDAAIT